MKPIYFYLVLLSLSVCLSCTEKKQDFQSPNILFVISDDQSFSHTSFAGSSFVSTPAFDRVAREGVYFANCIAGSPGCAPSRSSIVTGRYPWQNEQSGQHASAWLKKYVPFIDVLDENGYVTGRTGKGVAPFRYAKNPQDSLWRKTDAGGLAHSEIHYTEDKSGMEGYAKGVSGLDYFENFKYFIEHKRGDRPFFFWFGAKEPHRAYEKGSWKRMGKKLEDVEVPAFLPDNDEIRGDLLDYAVEIEWFDSHLGKMLNYLEDIGELENTIVIVTSDNGKPFPRAKANTYEYGIHVPMAVRYPKAFQGGRVIDAPLSFVDLAPTILEIAGASPEGMMPITGESFLKLLIADKNQDSRSYAFSGRERHSSSRYKNWGYPQRAVRSKDYLYIWNMRPERWPAGAPQKYDTNDNARLLPMNGIDDNGIYIPQSAYTDIDDCPTKTYLLEHSGDTDIKPYLDLAVAKRPAFELYDIRKDPDCLNNLAGKAEFMEVERNLNKVLEEELKKTKDPRVVGPNKEVFDSYKRYSHMRSFPEP
ncbi:sulfatase family protein [Echinicola salinicaeni]|uniref:sulfatase family protein n=1 Tax=Echinicola salinicaeni TaxID=2762757 RepID=UPI001649737C|nr:sulfatase [Echinicola salinicaeni]